MSRARTLVLLFAAIGLGFFAMETSWLSLAGVSPETQREVTVRLAGAAAVPLGTALVLVALIIAVGLLVLPWWLRIATATLGAAFSAVVFGFIVKFLFTPEPGDLIVAVSGSDVVREELEFVGPLALAAACLLLLLACLSIIKFTRQWGVLGARYERGQPRDMWGQLDRGIDPTQD
jgi:hypothetical protein